MSRHLRSGSLLAVILLAGCWWALGQVHGGEVGAAFWLGIVVLAVVAWLAMDQLAGDVLGAKAVPVLFGAWLLFLWEVIVVGFGVPRVLLPAPSAIAATFASSLGMLRADFVQTFVRAVIPGWIMGCSAGFIAALLIDRSPFLQRGLLPIGNLVSALPIIGVAPIMVMWFGFDWQSKAAVVVIMTFFPMLVNTTAGLTQTSSIERDLMHSYAASYVQTLLALRLPAAMPFVFNALKINATLALIGALVAEFFGTPIVGMGFRISTEVGRMNLDLVWATIAVAALAGSLSYALLAGIERMVTFWHPSYRRR
jgi:NitT/TauT family transport system permease protein